MKHREYYLKTFLEVVNYNTFMFYDIFYKFLLKNYCIKEYDFDALLLLIFPSERF